MHMGMADPASAALPSFATARPQYSAASHAGRDSRTSITAASQEVPPPLWCTVLEACWTVLMLSGQSQRVVISGIVALCVRFRTVLRTQHGLYAADDNTPGGVAAHQPCSASFQNSMSAAVPPIVSVATRIRAAPTANPTELLS